MLKFLIRKDPKKELQKVLGSYSLPSFPSFVLAALERLRDPEATPASIGAALSVDPGLSVRILGTVNSAAYALRREVKTVDHAIALLGIPTVESLVLSVAVAEAVPREAARGYDSRRFWQAAARRAAAARSLAQQLNPALASESFTASLLQDMAVPFLATSQGDRYGPILEQWHEGAGNLALLEQEHFGWNHAEVAVWLGTEWNLPDSLIAAIGGHHGPVSETTRNLKSPPAVFLVSHLRENEESLGIEDLVEAAQTRFGLPAEQVEALLQTSFQAAEELTLKFAPA